MDQFFDLFLQHSWPFLFKLSLSALKCLQHSILVKTIGIKENRRLRNVDKMKSEIIDILNFRMPVQRPTHKHLVSSVTGMENFKNLNENSP